MIPEGNPWGQGFPKIILRDREPKGILRDRLGILRGHANLLGVVPISTDDPR